MPIIGSRLPIPRFASITIVVRDSSPLLSLLVSLIARGRLSVHFAGGVLNRLDYVLIASAPAEVPLESMADLVIARIRVPAQDLGAGHYHAGREVSALQAVMFPESLLHRMKLAVPGEAFYSGNLGAISLNRQDCARLYCLAAQRHGARTADRGFASYVGAGQAQHVPQVMY